MNPRRGGKVRGLGPDVQVGVTARIERERVRVHGPLVRRAADVGPVEEARAVRAQPSRVGVPGPTVERAIVDAGCRGDVVRARVEEEVDGLVYCPGTINLKPFSRLTDEDFRSDFDINVMGAVRVLQRYEKILKKSDQGSVVLFSTVAAEMGMTFHSSVAVSKAGVEGLTKSLAAEWVPRIRVNAIAPTITDTSLAEKILRNDAMREKMKERHPLKRILDPSEVAELCVYLLSDGSASITGQVLKLDAGMLSVKV